MILPALGIAGCSLCSRELHGLEMPGSGDKEQLQSNSRAQEQLQELGGVGAGGHKFLWSRIPLFPTCCGGGFFFCFFCVKLFLIFPVGTPRALKGIGCSLSQEMLPF